MQNQTATFGSCLGGGGEQGSVWLGWINQPWRFLWTRTADSSGSSFLPSFDLTRLGKKWRSIRVWSELPAKVANKGVSTGRLGKVSIPSSIHSLGCHCRQHEAKTGKRPGAPSAIRESFLIAAWEAELMTYLLSHECFHELCLSQEIPPVLC